MIKDPIVHEIREIRHKIESECRDDPEVFYEWLVASQQKFGKRLVRRQPKSLSVESMSRVAECEEFGNKLC